MFGEMIGLWMAAVWQQMGAPENVRVVELGPGRGTLMADALRAAQDRQEFLHRDRAASRRDQPEAAGGAAAAAGDPRRADPVASHARPTFPAARAIIIANEFIDALPVHQAVKQADGWHERIVEIAPDGKLAIGIARDPLPHFDATLPRGIAAVARRLDL